MQIKNVAIIGAGAIGGVYAYSLHKLLGDNFAFIANGKRKERLEKIGDYTSYELSYEPQKRCQLKEKFTFEDKTFYFDCVDEVYLSYGSTKMTLEEALKNKYLTFADLTTGLFEEETDEEIFYEHEKTKTTQEYRFVVNKEKNTITFKGAIE